MKRDTVLRTTLSVDLDPAAAFDLIVRELVEALHLRGMDFRPGTGGAIIQNSVEAGHVRTWQRGKRILFDWRQAPWNPETQSEVEIRFDRGDGRTVIAFEHRGLKRLIGEDGELIGWFAREVAAQIIHAATPAAFGDWITDRRARRPSGETARQTYRDPLYHYPGFRAILEELELKPDDYLLEVGCGGGAFLKDALKSGCTAAAIDHSLSMVQQTITENQQAIDAGRLTVMEADAGHLPFGDGTFTCAVMTGVLGFLPNPEAALTEIHRILKPGGRIVIHGTDPELKGTPAAPEPIASRLRFADDKDLDRLGRAAGFGEVRVLRKDLEQFARDAGIPEEHVPLYGGPGTRFLVGRK